MKMALMVNLEEDRIMEVVQRVDLIKLLETAASRLITEGDNQKLAMNIFDYLKSLKELEK